MRRLRVRLAIALTATLWVVAGCVSAAEEPQKVSPPVLGFLVGHAGECSGPGGGVTAERIRAQAEGLVRAGLREAGYATLFVPCDQPVPAVDDPQLGQYLDQQRIVVERVTVADERVRRVIPAGAPGNVVRSAITRRIMLAESLVFSGDIGQLPASARALVANPQAIELALDDRRAPGAPVGGDQQIYSRAIGESGLLVSLKRAGPESPAQVSVAITDLNLAGDDSVPATEVWTGRRIHAVDGRLAVGLGPGDTALLRIG